MDLQPTAIEREEYASLAAARDAARRSRGIVGGGFHTRAGIQDQHRASHCCTDFVKVEQMAAYDRSSGIRYGP